MASFEFMCSNRCKIVFKDLRFDLTLFISNLCVKLVKNTNIPVEHCALIHSFRKRPGCALIGACALIKLNTVFFFLILKLCFNYTSFSNKLLKIDSALKGLTSE